MLKVGDRVVYVSIARPPNESDHATVVWVNSQEHLGVIYDGMDGTSYPYTPNLILESIFKSELYQLLHCSKSYDTLEEKETYEP